MNLHSLSRWFLGAAAVFALAGGGIAVADEPPYGNPNPPMPNPNPPPANPDRPAPPAPAAAHVLVFGDDVARFTVTHDRSKGQLTFHLLDPNVKIESAPVVIINQPNAQPRKVTLTAVASTTNTWTLSEPILFQDDPKFNGSMDIVVAGKTVSAPLVRSVWMTTDEVRWVAKHGGRVIAFADCPAHIEVVQDARAGTLLLYPLDGTVLTEAPIVQVNAKTANAGMVTVTKVEGQTGVWMASGPDLKNEKLDGSLRIHLAGMPCDAPLLAPAPIVGNIVTVVGGPRFEIVRDDSLNAFEFVALDETLDGRPVVIENPQIVLASDAGPRVLTLTAVEGKPRAFRLTGFVPVQTGTEATLRFTMNGKTLSTGVRLTAFSTKR